MIISPRKFLLLLLWLWLWFLLLSWRSSSFSRALTNCCWVWKKLLCVGSPAGLHFFSSALYTRVVGNFRKIHLMSARPLFLFYSFPHTCPYFFPDSYSCAFLALIFSPYVCLRSEACVALFYYFVHGQIFFFFFGIFPPFFSFTSVDAKEKKGYGSQSFLSLSLSLEREKEMG